MKKILFLFFALSHFVFFAQEGKILYTTTMLKDSTNFNEMFKKIQKEVNVIRFSLRYNKNKSYFKNIKHVPITDNLSVKLGWVFLGAPTEWYQNSVNKTAFYNKEISGKMYMVNHDKMKNWTLTNETKIIQDYTCYKALHLLRNSDTGKTTTIEAWYTTEIPVSFGPAGYGGLPGLILELKRANKHAYVASKITLNPEKKMKPFPSPNIENPIDVKEFSRLMRAARKVTED